MLWSRFVHLSEDDIQCFVDIEANTNTKKKTASDIALVEPFLANEGETRDTVCKRFLRQI